MYAKPLKRVKKSFADIFKPRKYQVKCIEWCLSRPAAALFLKPGLGKTVIILAVFHFLKKKGIVKRLFVVSNRRIIYNVWRQEIEKWNLPYTVALVHGGSKNKAGKTVKERALESDADIYLINFEALTWLVEKMSHHLHKFNGQMLVADESAKVKNWSSGRTKALKKLIPIFKRRYILAANPRPRSMMDLYAQIYMLDMGKALGKNITAFRNTYFYQYGQKEHGLYALLEGSEEKIYKAIRKLAIFFGDEQLDLPPMIEVPRVVTLPDKSRGVYNDLEQNFITFLKSGVITAANAGVATNKLRQIAGGSVYLPYKTRTLETRKPKRGKFETLHDEKVKEVEQIVSELNGRPVFISYEYDHERLALQKLFPDAPAIFSDTTDAAGERFIKQWNRGELPVLLGQSQSVSHGLNLQEIDASVIYFSFSWDFDAFDQFRRRIWRQGQVNKVYVYYVIADDTIDTTMFNVLQLKNANQERMFSALKQDLLNVNQKGLFKMATSKAKKLGNKKVAKKKAATKRKVAKKVTKRKAPAKKAAKKKVVKKKRVQKKTAKRAARPKGLKKGKHDPTLNRNADGLRKGSVQAAIVDMSRRKTGATIAQIEARTDSTAASIRVNVALLKKRGFGITNDNGAYKLR